MGKQIILCMETNKKAGTDFVYINETIKQFYTCDNSTKIRPLFMGSKSKYNSKDVKKEIEKNIKEYINGETKVIYCIDTDSFEIDNCHRKEFDEIKKYCSDHQYDMIWFCHDVEEVYLKERVSNKEKVSKAADFRNKNSILGIPQDRLSSKAIRKNTSNILLILNKYLSRKLE